ncbi:MAG: 4-hydroxy-tetrahydrodipicolinate synthase, partial [Oscillospiraceae bacterium]
FSMELAKEMNKIGVDGLLLVTPYYNKTSQKGLVESFSAIADCTDSPVIVYNVPSRTTVNILPETYCELAKHPHIVGVKEANHDVSSVAKTISLCGDSLTIYSGEDDQVLPIMALGGKGVISVFSNVMPKEMHELCAALLREDYRTARAMTSKYIKLMNTLFMDVNPIPVKEALSKMGYCSNKCRLPLTDMTTANKEKLTTVMQEYSLI